MPRLSRVFNTLLFWSAAFGIVVVAVESARPSAESRPPGMQLVEACQRCRDGSECQYYDHTAGRRAEYEASNRRLVDLGAVEPDE